MSDYDWAFEPDMPDVEFYGRGITHGKDSVAEGRGCLCTACAPQEYQVPEDARTPEEVAADKAAYEAIQAELEAKSAADTSPF